jgi:FO synthase
LLREAEPLVVAAVDVGRLERAPAERLGSNLDDPRIREALLEGADESKRRGKGKVVTVSRNVFIPLTNLCRNRCNYCTFAKTPGTPEAKTYPLAEVGDLAERAFKVGCIEALFCLGDKPEMAHRSYRRWLQREGYGSTADYLVEACRVAFQRGMLPHTNAGLLTQEQMAALRAWNASMGLMLETTSQRLRQKGMAHFWAPDKDPVLRVRMHREAGELGIPFTSGMLLGIGENVKERVDTLLTIRELADRYGHIQETIIQPFHAKPDTRMRDVSGPSTQELAGWVALARLILGPEMNVQVPPNLEPSKLELLLRSGVNDWGGVSPLTVDFINPEAPWPTLRELRHRTEAAGCRLRDRLPVYPADLLTRPERFHRRVREAALRLADEEGYARPHPTVVHGEAA